MTDIDTFPAPGITPAEDGADLGRRLEDKILLAFHQACDQKDEQVARRLLEVLEFTWMRDRDNPGRRRNVSYLLAARARCRHLAGPVPPRR